MANIRLHKDQLNPLACEARSVGAVNLLEWLHANAPWADVVVRNGKQLDEEADADVTLSEFDEVDVFAVAQAAEIGIGWLIAIAVGAAVISYALMPKPQMPNAAGEVKDSPNNRLNAATNSFRPRQAMPHIYGEVRAYPDFIQSSYYIYKNNIKEVYEVFNVGVGYIDVSEIKSSESPLDDTTVYQPNDTLPTFYDVRGTNEVDGQEIEPADKTASSISLVGGIVTGTDTIEGVDNVLNLLSGDVVTITNMSWNQGAEFFSGDATVASAGDGSITFSDVTWVNSTPTDGEIMSGILEQPTTSPAANWFTLIGDEIEEVRAHIIAPQGLYDQNGDPISIEIELQVQALDVTGTPTGSILTKIAFISAGDQAPQYRTVEMLSLTPSRYQARVVRATNKITGAVDTLQLEGLDSVTPIDTSAYGDVTLLETKRRATLQATSGRSPKTNCIAQLLLPIFDPATGTFGARAATRSAAQAVMDLLVNKAGEPLANIDYERLFEVVPNDNLGYFDFTFDDKDVSIGEALQTILNAARCYYYMVGNRYTFERDEAKPVRTMLFNRRNTLPEASEQSYTLYRSADYDSVEVKYVSPIDNSEGYVRRRINSTTGAIETGLGEYVNEITLAGCRNEAQAINRAELEIRKIKYLWLQVKDTVTSEGLTVGLGQRVGWCDINDSEVFDGEVLADLGAGIYELSEPWTPEVGTTYYVYIVQADGTVSSSVEVTQPAGEPYQMSAAGLSASIADGYEIQQGSLYVIAPLTGLNARDFTITRRDKPDENYNVGLEMVNYDERVYEMD